MTDEHRLSFAPSAPIDAAGLQALRALPEVDAVSVSGDRVTVTGNAHVVRAVMARLARRQVLARHLRIEAAPPESGE